VGDIAPHQIRRADVAQYLSRSAVQRTYFHSTDLSGYRRLMRDGVGQSRLTQFGHGFYTAATPARKYGPQALEVAIDSRRPFHYSHEALAQLVGPEHARRHRFHPESKVAVGQALREAGFDAVIQRADEVDWVVALEGSTVRLVSDSAHAAEAAHALRIRAAGIGAAGLALAGAGAAAVSILDH
jgi:hypothetical protein